MSKTSEHHTAVKDESTDRFSSELQELKAGFGQLREDVTELLANASDTAKSGAEALKDRARNLKHRGAESVEQLENRIVRKPMLSVALALGVGFVMARVFMPHR